MKYFILSYFLFAATLFSHAQENYWSPRDFSNLKLDGEQFIFPNKYSSFELDYLKLKAYTFNAPLDEINTPIANSSTQIAIPMPDGSFENFHLAESPVYQAELVANFPDIKTFLGYNKNHPTWYARFDITPAGFHAMILGTDKGTVFIDPIMHLGDIKHYFSYYKKDFEREHEKLICSVNSKQAISTGTNNHSNGPHKSFGSCELRTYRLAISATGEYTQFHGGTVGQALAAQVTTMNRVNGIFERDMAIHMDLIGNNNLIIYTNGATDPFSNGNTGAMINENQTNTDAVIGSANYDIGHIFGTNSGGLAQLFSPCSSNKARGVTGSGAPVGDPFDVDYVAHEMGHQFGARHTQNNNCNRSNNTAVEPGSASTIMGYAGICAPNIQSNSDDYFHGISMEEMGNFITGGSHTCPVTTPLGNTGPSVNVPYSAITIPASTPFSLTANGFDPNAGNTLTYCWEQMDNAVATMPPVSTNTDGPAFRSLDPSTSPTRYFPNLPDVIAGVTPTWEVLSSVTRSMSFRVVLRDNASGGGCNDHQDITVNIEGSAGPFLVNNPNSTGVNWTGNSNETVTWSVANTDIAPVSCGTVNILISYDGGNTFPDTLATGVPNDGSHSVTVPNIATSNALVIVQCANGTFYDVSDNEFTITAITNDFTFSSNTLNTSVCPGDDAVYNLSVGLLGVFNNVVTLSASGLPVGLNSTFSANAQAPVYSAVFTITNTNAVAPGVYNFTLQASTLLNGTKTLNVSIEIRPNLSGTVSTVSPVNSATGVSSPTSITWSPIVNAAYNIILSTDPSLTSSLETADSLTSANFTTGILPPNTSIYWQVQAFNSCDTITSAIFSFTTENCLTYTSTDIPVAIPSSGTPTVSSTIVISGAVGTINDINVVNLTGTHTYISDLTFTLSSPNSTSVVLLDNICSFQNNFDINFDDAAANNNYPCPPTDGGTYLPEASLAAFNGEDANGTWILTIDDAFNQDGGSLASWGLEICFDSPCTTSTAPSITPIPGIFCPNSSTTLNASGGISEPGSTINWYTGPNGTGTSLGIGNSITVTVDTTQTFYVRREGSCNITTDNSVTLNVRPFVYALDGATSVGYCTDNSGWHHFFNASNEVIFSVDGDLSGASPGFPIASIADNGLYYEENQGPNLPGSCASGLDPGEHRFEMQRSWNLDFGLGSQTPPYSVRFYYPVIERTAIETAASSFITSFPACGYTYKYASPLGFYWFKNTGSNYSAPSYDGTQISGLNASTPNSINYVELAGITSFSGGSGAVSLVPSTNLYLGVQTDVVSACDSFTWIDGNTYTSSNNTATFEIAGGDTLLNLDLTILNTPSGIDTQVACGSFTWIDGNTYTSNNNTATFNITNGASNGCDSLVSLNLTINNSVSSVDTRTACDSLVWIDGNTYTSNNNSATFIIPNGAANNCDSLLTLDLTIINSSMGVDSRTACDSLVWIDGNTYFSNNNSATFNIIAGASNGCDSLVSLDLTINNNSPITTINLTTCSAALVGSDTTTTTNSVGCDSTVITNTTLLAGNSSSQSVVACDSVLVAGTWYFTSTITTDTIFSGASNGCDSTVNYNIIINNSITTDSAVTACDSAQVNGIWYFSTQNIIDNNTSGTGCDSVHTTILNINNSIQTSASLTACDSAQVFGTWYFSSQAIDSIFSGSNSCDSTHTVNLTINSSSPITNISLTTCQASQVASDTTALSNAAGCDSIVVTNTSLLSGSTQTQSLVGCDSVLAAGTWYTNSTIVNDTLIGGASNGCDSIITYNILINNSTQTSSSVTACDSAQVNGTWYFTSQSVLSTSVTSNGCDSLHQTLLNINPSSFSTDTRVACDSLTWIDGITYTSSTNTPNISLTNSVGCDSIVTLDLIITNSSTGVDNRTACDSLTWIDGNTYTTSNNSATFTVSNSVGCDSLVTLNLIINNSVIVNDVGVVCDSLTWIDGNTYYNSTNTPSVSLTSASGCDSIVTLDLTVFYTNVITDNRNACDSLTWINGITYTASTNGPSVTLTNTLGCDSIVVLDLNISNSTTGVDNITACDSITWLDGVTYTSPNNTATFTTTNAAGCDSVLTLNFSLLPGSSGVDSVVSCGPFTWIDGLTYNTSNNTANFTLSGANGCDSVVTLNLTVNNSSSSTDVVSRCGSYTWIDGVTYFSSNNTATAQLTNAAGCDSIVNLDLTISNVSTSTDVQTACDQYTWIDGVTYTTSNNTASYTITGGAANGCDSTVLLDLTLSGSEGNTFVLTACDSYTWVNGVTYTSTILNESYIVAGATSSGCDSLYFLDLTILSSGSDTDVVTACGSYTWIDGITYSSDNSVATYTVSGGNPNGCDLTMSLDLTIESVPTISITSSNGVLSATPGLSNYQWYRNGQAILGATSQSYTPTSWGLHTCSTIDGFCEGFSNGIVISLTGLNETTFDYVGVYPNPVTDLMRIDVGNESLEAIRLIDIRGKIVATFDESKRTFYLGDYAKGMYVLELMNNDKRSLVKIILK